MNGDVGGNDSDLIAASHVFQAKPKIDVYKQVQPFTSPRQQGTERLESHY